MVVESTSSPGFAFSFTSWLFINQTEHNIYQIKA